MKICVFSDSHGNSLYMLRAIEEHSPDMIFHLGDGERDTDKIKSQFPQIPLKRVCGNCDWYSMLPNVERVNVYGANIMLTHGHLYHVKSGTDELMEAARREGMDMVLYGHTHIPQYDLIDGLHILNPGSCQTSSGSYALAEISPEGKISCRLFRL